MPVKAPPPEQLERLKRDLPYYCSAALKIRTKSAELKYFEFNFAQRIVHKKIADQYRKTGKVRAIVLKARQEGVSTYVAGRFFRRLSLESNQYGLVIAKDVDQSKTIFGIYDRFWMNVPPELRPEKRFSQKNTELHLDNPDDEDRARNPGLDSKITVETANNLSAGRGGTLQFIHASEIAFWDKGQDAWVSLIGSIPDHDSEVIIESTANGRGGMFYDMWNLAVEGASDYIAIFLPWWIHEEYTVSRLSIAARQEVLRSRDPWEKAAMHKGFFWEGKYHKLTPEQIVWRRNKIADYDMAGVDGERAFRQEFPSTAEEAFLVSGNAFFDEDALARYRLKLPPPPARCNLIEPIGGAIFPQPAERGYLRIVEPPRRDGVYVISADTASGRQVSPSTTLFSDPDSEKYGTDFSCADVIEVQTRKQVAQLHGRMAPEVFAEFLNRLGYFYSSPGPKKDQRVASLLGVERNHSSGETVLNLLKHEYRYPSLYYSRPVARRREKPQDRLGWTTNAESRQVMLDDLAADIRNGDITITIAETIKEMETFVRDDTGKPQAQIGAHDDRVITIAIGRQLCNHVDTRPRRGFRKPLETADTATGWMAYA